MQEIQDKSNELKTDIKKLQIDCDMFFNRELSWLRFNSRVLLQAQNTKLPLLERLKFLAIYSTNLDEFYMIRVAGLKRLFASGVIESGPDKLTPLQQLTSIREYVHKEKAMLQTLYYDITTRLHKEGLFLSAHCDLNKAQKEAMKHYFKTYIYPIIVPIVVDFTHPFPHLNNLSFGIALKLKSKENDEVKYGIIRIPRVLKRFIEVSKGLYILSESLVGEFAGELFTGFECVAYAPFRVTRNADMEIEEEEADDFIELMSEGLRARKKGEITRLEFGICQNAKEQECLLNFINKQIKVDSADVYTYDIPLGCSGFWEIIGVKEFAHLNITPYIPKILPPLNTYPSIFESIDNDDILLFHPYESFDPVVNFIQQAAKDPSVLSIRMTLYRVGKNSPIIKALTEAAENKQVTVLVELKARFDEENNLHWAKSLEAAGAHVIYGVPLLKVHAKIALVIKKCADTLKSYVHLSTGNYNSATAKIYTDVSLFSANEGFANDAIRLFHSLSTGSSRKTELGILYTAPTQIKQKLLELIKTEKGFKKEGHIILKANACVDVDIIKALYEANNEGVKIDLIIRGVCCLKPGVKGFSENIRVFSIVGKYLEHARIYYFKNTKEQIFFSSADIMPRNLERRVELLTPALKQHVKDKLLGILKLQLSDNMQRFELRSDGEYEKLKNSDKPISSQEVYESVTSKIYNDYNNDNQSNSDTSKAKKLIARMMRES